MVGQREMVLYVLASRETLHELLQTQLGERVSADELTLMVDDIVGAAKLEWEELPEGINPDLGYNFEFLVCRETCWLGRALDAGEHFVVFRYRGEAGREPIQVGPQTAEPVAAGE
ncbi:MAG: hypothetical protein CL878_08605 [Dehalococcoidia bacterium]|nr:hypothetical protein [Dehalococcoidia bacterium]